MSPRAELVLRPATAADWNAVAALLQRLGLPLDGAQQHLPWLLLALDDTGQLLACAGVEPHGDVGLLRSVAVAPAHQGRGLARRLVLQLVDDARRRGWRSLHLLTTTAPDWFARLGFRHEDRTRAPAALQASAEFRGACPASAVFMSLALQEPDDAAAG